MVDLQSLIENETNRYAKRFYQLLHKEGYNLVGDSRYKNSRLHVKIKHLKCNYEYLASPNQFQQGRRCPKCAGKRRLNTKSFKEKVYELEKDSYTVLGIYKNTKTPLEMRHNNELCNNHKWNVRPRDFLHKNSRCPKCANIIRANNMRKTNKQFKEEVFKLVGNEYRILSEYDSYVKKIRLKHLKCGYKYTVTPGNFISHGKRCPRCNQSKGENLVEKILKENNFTYIPQDKFDECKNIRVLPFDFGVYNNDELIALIEYQGIQHYEPVEHFGAEENFKLVQLRDEIKRKFCKENNIPLIEIHYSLTDKQVSDFLLSKLNKLLFKEVI